MRYTHNITFQKIEMYSKKNITRYIASTLVFATVKKPKVYILRRLQNTIKKAAGDYSELIGALWMCCNMVVAVYLLIRTYQQLYALIKSGKCVFLHVIILIATMVPAKRIAINCLQFFSTLPNYYQSMFLTIQPLGTLGRSKLGVLI